MALKLLWLRHLWGMVGFRADLDGMTLLALAARGPPRSLAGHSPDTPRSTSYRR